MRNIWEHYQNEYAIIVKLKFTDLKRKLGDEIKSTIKMNNGNQYIYTSLILNS